jgi:crossover junction endodeoxyribonuclease RusA
VADARTEARRVELSLPFPPSVNALFFNVPGRGRVKTDTYTGWENEAAWLLASQKPGRIVGDYEIEITAFRPDKRRRDLGNLEKGISDLLVSQRVIQDDRFAQKITLQWGSGGEGCRVILTKAEAA